MPAKKSTKSPFFNLFLILLITILNLSASFTINPHPTMLTLRSTLTHTRSTSSKFPTPLSSSLTQNYSSYPPPSAALLKHFQQTKTRTQQSNQTLLEGSKLINDCSQTYSVKITSLIGTKTGLSKIHASVISEIRGRGCVFEISDNSSGAANLKRICSTSSPQPVIALVDVPVPDRIPRNVNDDDDNDDDDGDSICRSNSSDDSDNFTIILDGLQDPGNVGTLIRTYMALPLPLQSSPSSSTSQTNKHINNKPVVLTLPNTVNLYNPKVVRASAGSVFGVDVLAVKDFDDVKAVLGDIHGGRVGGIWAATMNTDADADAETEGNSGSEGKTRKSINHFDVPYTSNFTSLILGSEGSGLSHSINSAVKKGEVETLHVEMREGGGESLNVGVVGCLLMSERVRQFRVKEKGGGGGGNGGDVE